MEDAQDQRGCMGWMRRHIFDRVPNVALVILAVLILILLLSAIPLAVFITYMAPSSADVEVSRQSVARFHDDTAWTFNEENNDRALIAMRTAQLKPPNMTSCVEHGFSCTNNPNVIISHNKRCDGSPDCPDGSDEADCEKCKTSFSCALRPGSSQKHCLRGHTICDGFADCKDQSDELLFCHAKCEDKQYKCANADRCIPDTYRCDGDEQCPGGDDEEKCTACTNAAILCKSTGRCIPQWMQCDGFLQCPDGSDELNCDCNTCSAAKSALCALSNMCIDKSQVCDGAVDCPSGEDEAQCAGSCGEPIADVRAGEIVCRDGKAYAWKYACSGLYNQCDGICESCNLETSINCGDNSCLHRSRVCDGIADCPNATDERDCAACDADSKRCDGFPDCFDGHDERDCTACEKGALHCRADKMCISSHQRCDGYPQCSDAEDELNCSCQECAVHPFQTYHCKSGQRCFRMDEVCGPQTRCPKPSRLDRMYCATRNSRRSFF